MGSLSNLIFGFKSNYEICIKSNFAQKNKPIYNRFILHNTCTGISFPVYSVLAIMSCEIFSETLDFTNFLMPAVGLEPTRCCHQQILSLPRLPFRHAGLCMKNIYLFFSRKKYLTITVPRLQPKFLFFSCFCSCSISALHFNIPATVFFI